MKLVASKNVELHTLGEIKPKHYIKIQKEQNSSLQKM